MTLTNTLRNYFRRVAEEAENIERVKLYSPGAIQSVQVQEGNLTYTIGTPNCKEETNARHSKCSGCGSSEFKSGRCVYCRSYR